MVWGGMATVEKLNKIKRVQEKCLKLIKPTTPPVDACKELQILSLDQLIDLEHKKLGYKISKNLLPNKMIEIIRLDQYNNTLNKKHNYNTRNKAEPNIPKPNTKNYQKRFFV